MCGRLACTLCPEELRKACAYPKQRKENKCDYVEPTYIENAYQYVPLYNLCPSGVVPILADKSHFPEASDCSDFIILPMRWGMLPRWNAEKSAYHTHNTRIEGAMQSNFFKPEFLKNRRCVVLCDGYFEWQTTRADKQPYYIYQEKIKDDCPDDKMDWMGKPLLKLAGIFSSKIDSEGITRYSCSIITKDSDKRLSWLHDRMPIMLETFDDVENWINCEKLNCDESFKFISTYEESKPEEKKQKYALKYHPVDKKFVNDSSCKSEKCIERVNVKRQNTLDSWFCKRPATSK
ncbi:hypothetical protein ILUMI_23274 [Ignelater luminosus]|uniref:Abasic site processing protein HMCES n=1 Tax=Ignelater luminosus TaxID=2038154 RepID=A0A8K0CE65_IGNLU|nr:hypothetical protein ILUMI_23274 [Ignelater luminosus]